MATTLRICAPNTRELLTPLLPSLPAAALSSQPAPPILPLLSPILRQRVQLLTSAASNEPWLRLLTYDKTREARLSEVARSDRLEPHPVSGEVEVDWDYDVQTRYRRLDEETLQALLVLEDFELFFRLVYCVGDEAGGGDGWRVGEVGVPDKTSPLASFAGFSTIEEADKAFAARLNTAADYTTIPQVSAPAAAAAAAEEEDDDDDDYWARYDATPARTPQPNPSPAPATQQSQAHISESSNPDEDDAYYAQYDSVQPAMDNHDPDEAQAAAEQYGIPPPSAAAALHAPIASRQSTATTTSSSNDTNGGWTLAPSPAAAEEERMALAHPRPASSASSNGSETVLRLEQQAGQREQGEFGVRQHVSRSIRSLFLLSRAAGMDRVEFENMVRTELDVLGMIEEDM